MAYGDVNVDDVWMFDEFTVSIYAIFFLEYFRQLR